MSYTAIVSLTPGKIVKVKGWVKRIRRVGKKLVFIRIADFSGSVQLVLTGPLAKMKVPLESAVSACGEVVSTTEVLEGLEIQISSCELVGEVKVDLPFAVNGEEIQAGQNVIFDSRAFSLRHPKIQAIFKLQSEIIHQFSNYLRSNKFTEIKSPKIVGGATESGSSVFQLDYFGQPAFLAQSPQFYKQMMVGSGLERVFEIGPVFRAEHHQTSRHINEYTSLDVEMGFISDIETLMALEEALLMRVFNYINHYYRNELTLLGVYPLNTQKFARLSLQEALAIIKQHYHYDVVSKDIDPEGERLIAQYAREKWQTAGIFLTDYPIEARPFYALPKSNGLTHSFDLIFNGTEITTGGLRIHDPAQLKQSMFTHHLSLDDLSGYVQMFSLGMPPHGGFAIGLERLTAQLLGLNNIKEATLFPRDMHRLTP